VEFPYRNDPFDINKSTDKVYLNSAYCFLAPFRIRQTLNRSKEVWTLKLDAGAATSFSD